MTVNRNLSETRPWLFLTIKPIRCTNFWNLFFKWNSTCFRQFLCPSSGVFHCTHINGICHTVLQTACEQDQDGTAAPSWSCSQAVCKPLWHIPLLCVQWKTPDDRQRNCRKHVEFYSTNKFEKLVHLVGFIVRNLTRFTVTWTSKTLAADWLHNCRAHTVMPLCYTVDWWLQRCLHASHRILLPCKSTLFLHVLNLAPWPREISHRIVVITYWYHLLLGTDGLFQNVGKELPPNAT